MSATTVRPMGEGKAAFTTEEVGDVPPAFWAELRARTRPEHQLLAVGAWWTAWAAAYLGQSHWRGPLRAIVARDGAGAAAGVLPLATLRVARLDLPALGGFYQPYRTLPLAHAASREAALALADAVDAGGAAAVRLGGCEEPDEGVLAFLKRLRTRGWAVHEETKGYVYALPLPPTFADFEAGLHKRLLHNIRYYDRKMRKDVQVEHRLFHACDADEWGRAVGELGAIEDRSWLHTKGGDKRFSGAANARFWTTLLADADVSRAARAWVLYFDGKPVSFTFALDSGGTRFVLANHYDEAVAVYTTGSILYHRLFADAYEQKLSLVHLGGGDSGYKARWGAGAARVLRDYVACRPSLKGRALFTALTLRSLAQQLRKPGGEEP
jgi:CelD/BcsL family acetyltransferase involved in cellulose biosynthesis